MSRFYLTTAIDYVNSRPHLGTAYEKIAADVIARYKRLCGIDTRFLMGNDEHSQNVFQRARELDEDPIAFCDRMETTFRDVWARLDISFDDFIRTTEERHRTSVTTLVSRIVEAGDIYDGVYEGWYCVSCEAFKQERDLDDGNCPIHHEPPEWIREKNYFFRLSKYRDPLLEHYERQPSFLEPEIRRNEMLRLLDAGLDDISMSRTGQAWGIPVPSDPDSVIYVWVDALINYISGVGYGADPALFDTWWPADLHVIGKDITRFHCVVWPAMLMSAGVALPRQIFGHGWVHWQGQKMSKSLGTVVDPLEAADRLGPDPLRLYLTKEIAFGADGDFTWDRFEERYNVDLANNYGNLVSRLASMGKRYRRGNLVAPPGRARSAGGSGDARGGAVSRGDGRLRTPPGDRGSVRSDRRRERIHHARGAVGDGARSGAGGGSGPAALGRERGGPDCGGAADAGDAAVVRGGARPGGRVRPGGGTPPRSRRHVDQSVRHGATARRGGRRSGHGSNRQRLPGRTGSDTQQRSNRL